LPDPVRPFIWKFGVCSPVLVLELRFISSDAASET
jgi:hypothetical protein